SGGPYRERTRRLFVSRLGYWLRFAPLAAEAHCFLVHRVILERAADPLPPGLCVGLLAMQQASDLLLQIRHPLLEGCHHAFSPSVLRADVRILRRGRRKGAANVLPFYRFNGDPASGAGSGPSLVAELRQDPSW